MLLRRFNWLVQAVDLRYGYAFGDLSTVDKYKKMKNEREQAVFAWHVIKTIGNAQNSSHQDMLKPSLRDCVLDLHINRSDFTYDQENRNAVLDIFKKGVILNPKVFRQPKLIDLKEANQQQNSKYFIFCPTLLVTRPIFECLLDDYRKIMAFGSYGIGKTAAIILFHYLSSIINKYIYRASKDQDQKKILQQLKQDRLLIEVPKIFYWSIDPLESQKYTRIMQSLLQQATELQNDQKKILLQEFNKNFNPDSDVDMDDKSFESFTRKLKRFYYNRRIDRKLVLDQMNVLTSMMKISNQFRQYYNNEKKKNPFMVYLLQNEMYKIGTSDPLKTQTLKKNITQIQNRQENIERDYKQNQETVRQPASKLRFFVCDLMWKLGQSKLYGSSTHSQIQLFLERDGFDDQNIKLQIERKGKQETQQNRVQFSQSLKHQWGCNDFYHYFWFEVEKTLQAKGFSDKLSILKTHFYQKAKGKESQHRLPSYVRNLNIGQMFESDPQLLNFSSQSSDQTVLLKLDRIIRFFPDFAKERCVAKALQFIRKGRVEDVQKKFLLMERLVQLTMTIKADKINSPMQFTVPEIQGNYLEGAFRIYLRSNHYNRQFLPIQRFVGEYWDKTVRFQWTYAEFSEIGWRAIVTELRDSGQLDLAQAEFHGYLSEQPKKIQYFVKRSMVRAMTPKIAIQTPSHFRSLQAQLLSKLQLQ